MCCTVPNAEDNQCCPTKTACVTVLLFITDSSVTRWLPGCSKHCNSTRASDVFWVLKVTRSFLHCISLYYVRQCTEVHIFVINRRTLQTPNICRSWLSQISERFQSFQQTSRWKEMSIQSFLLFLLSFRVSVVCWKSGDQGYLFALGNLLFLFLSARHLISGVIYIFFFSLLLFLFSDVAEFFTLRRRGLLKSDERVRCLVFTFFYQKGTRVWISQTSVWLSQGLNQHFTGSIPDLISRQSVNE